MNQGRNCLYLDFKILIYKRIKKTLLAESLWVTSEKMGTKNLNESYESVSEESLSRTEAAAGGVL